MEKEVKKQSGSACFNGTDGAKKLLSVIVPAYNAEKYIRTALDSFCMEEILDDIEILVINDGSTDQTGAVAAEYQARFPGTFRVITKPNGGHGSGINAGILLARGKYFKVVDSDDWVDREPFCRLVDYLRDSEADIVWSGFYWVYEDEKVPMDSWRKRAEMLCPFEGVEYGRTYVFDGIAEKLYIKMHNMTIRTRILQENKIRVDEKCYYVDTEYTIFPIPHVSTAAFIDEFVYMYRIGRNGQSMSREKMQKNEENMKRVLKSLLRFYDRLGSEIPCTPPKKQYIANLTARAAAGYYRIMLCQEEAHKSCMRLSGFDSMLKKRYPDIYEANINRAVTLLRGSHFRLYDAASALCRIVYR